MLLYAVHYGMGSHVSGIACFNSPHYMLPFVYGNPHTGLVCIASVSIFGIIRNAPTPLLRPPHAHCAQGHLPVVQNITLVFCKCCSSLCMLPVSTIAIYRRDVGGGTFTNVYPKVSELSQ